MNMIVPDGVDITSFHSYEKVHIEKIYDDIPLGKEDVVVDVGSCMGILSKYLRDRVGRIIGIEPFADNIPYLLQNCPGITVHQCGAWDREAELEFRTSPIIGMNHFVGWDPGHNIEFNKQIIKVRPLDIILKDEPRIDFINMDIEGSELRAVMGAKEIILKHKPRMIISTYHRSRDIEVIPDIILDMVPEYKVQLLGSTRNRSVLFYI